MRIFELSIGSVVIAPSYYGMMYALAFVAGYMILKRVGGFTSKQLDTLMTYLLIGVILGGRLGYVLIYDLPYFMDHPWEILQPWRGGMSFHGGLLGVISASYLFARRIHRPWLPIIELLAWITPIGLMFGRIGNFLNGELFGLPGYTGCLAQQIGEQTYFPTPLLEATLEGPVLLIILLIIRRYVHTPGMLGASFLLLYGLFRFVSEFFRSPDAQIGYLAGGWLTMGHVLSLMMIAVGCFFLVYFWKRK